MEIAYFIFVYFKKIRLIPLVILLISVCSCTNALKKPSASLFSFIHDGEKYRIRSISCEDNSVACNELVGKNVFAKDFDKDAIIDQIILGDMDLPVAQKIYEFGLNILRNENKLSTVETKIQSFKLINDQYIFEIKSFLPGDYGVPFNQFIIFSVNEDRNPLNIFIDENANGSLDKTLKGNIMTKQYQNFYSDTIKQGLLNSKLVNTDNMILVTGQ